MKPRDFGVSDTRGLGKLMFGIAKAVTSPRSSLSWIVRGHLAKDRVFVSQTYWHTGQLPRVPLAQVLPHVSAAEVVLPCAFDRTWGTSVTVEEACHLGAIAKGINAVKALEIGTFDGNSALVLAANMGDSGEVITVDLPSDFDEERQHSLKYSNVELNLTERTQLGRQYRGHRSAGRIRQVYGDSGQLDWSTLGGPFNLIFIDGCHAEEYVRSDTRNAFRHLAPGGAIVWHDYGMIPDVSRVVDQMAAEMVPMRAYALEGTRLAMALS